MRGIMTFTVGLIGLGKIGAFYDLNSSNTMTHLNAISKDIRFSLSFAYDPSETTCASVREYYDIENVFHNMTDIQNDKLQADLIVVASPTNSHLDSIQSLLEFISPLMVLCEKPLADNLLDSQKIADLCRQKNINIATNFMRRSLPLFGELKEQIASQFTGPHDVVVKYSGCFRNNGSHFVDLISYFYGEPESVLWRSSEKTNESEFKVRAIVSHKNAVCSYIPLSSISVVDHEVEILTDDFKLVIGRAGRDVHLYEVEDDPDFSGAFQYGKNSCLDSDYLNFQKYVYSDLYMALTSGTLPSNLCDIDSSLRNVQFIKELTHYEQ
jgi:predicted dehydrogenase